MKEEIKIKSLNEYFSQSLGDSFNSSNGVFKVNYRTYDDLSIPVGREPDPSLLIKDSAYKIGDLVSGRVKGMKKRIKGEVVEVNKSLDGKFYIIKIKRFKNNKIYTLIPGSIRFLEDRGNIVNNNNIDAINAKQRSIQALKYDGGNIIWGSMESKNFEDFYHPINDDNVIDGPLGTGWKIYFVDNFPEERDLLFNSFMIDPKNNLIITLRSYLNDEFKDKIKAAESYCFIFYHPDLNQYGKDLKALISVLLLEMKNENNAKKYLIQYFPEITGRSYGEARDELLEKAKSIINIFLNM